MSFHRWTPNGTCLGAVFFCPPATGYKPRFRDEAERLAESGLAVLAWRASYLSGTAPARGPQNPESEARFWAQLPDEALNAWLADPLSQSSLPWAVAGFNLGGSVAAAFVGRTSARGFIAAGSVPRLSDFWIESSHPVAASARAQGTFEASAFRSVARPHDLTTRVRQLKVPALLQFGTRDPWIEAPQAREIETTAPPNCRFFWAEDDHDMLGKEAQEARFSFLHSLLGDTSGAVVE